MFSLILNTFRIPLIPGSPFCFPRLGWLNMSLLNLLICLFASSSLPGLDYAAGTAQYAKTIWDVFILLDFTPDGDIFFFLTI